MRLRNFRHFKKVNLKSAASLNYVCFFSKPRISLHWFVPMLTAKQHSHKRSRKCFGWRQIDLKESSKKTFFGVGMLCQTQFTPHWMLMQREHVSGLFSNHLYVSSNCLRKQLQRWHFVGHCWPFAQRKWLLHFKRVIMWQFGQSCFC
jgi:hypothetical protein